MQYTEKDLIIPTLAILFERNTGISTTELIDMLFKILNPTGHDVEIIKKRKDTYFSQKVRNLVSHKTLVRKKFTDFEGGIHKIRPEGVRFLVDNAEGYKFMFENGFSNEQRDLITERDYSNLVIEEGFITLTQTKSRTRSKLLIDAAKKHFTINNKIYCSACNFCFYDYYGPIGVDYIEIHHIKPIFGYGRDGYSLHLKDALKNVVPLCSNCHRMVHRQKGEILPINNLILAIRENGIR